MGRDIFLVGSQASGIRALLMGVVLVRFSDIRGVRFSDRRIGFVHCLLGLGKLTTPEFNLVFGP